MRRPVQFFFDASWKYATVVQCHFGRVENAHDASKITLKYNSIVRLRVQNVYDALKADSTRRKYSRLFFTRRKYVYVFCIMYFFEKK